MNIITKLFIPIGEERENLELVDNTYRLLFRNDLCEDFFYGASLVDSKEVRINAMRKFLVNQVYVTVNIGAIPGYNPKTETPVILWHYRFQKNTFEQYQKESVDFKEIETLIMEQIKK